MQGYPQAVLNILPLETNALLEAALFQLSSVKTHTSRESRMSCTSDRSVQVKGYLSQVGNSCKDTLAYSWLFFVDSLLRPSKSEVLPSDLCRTIRWSYSVVQGRFCIRSRQWQPAADLLQQACKACTQHRGSKELRYSIQEATALLPDDWCSQASSALPYSGWYSR